MQLYTRLDNAAQRMTGLQTRIQELEATIDAAASSTSEYNDRLRYLEERFREGLEVIQAPRFPNPGPTMIDRESYLPIVDGRRSGEWMSQGLRVMINIAHAIAHQLTALHFGIPLPYILLIDDVSGNLGYEGLDWDRIEALYRYILDVSSQYEDAIQVIVADNTVPPDVRDFVKVTFDENNKLIPDHLIRGAD